MGPSEGPWGGGVHPHVCTLHVVYTITAEQKVMNYVLRALYEAESKATGCREGTFVLGGVTSQDDLGKQL